MNLGIIAHNSKKVLIEDFCIAYKNISLPNTKYMQPEQREEELRKRPAFMSISFLPEALAETSSLWRW